jgi:hypothetical protein
MSYAGRDNAYTESELRSMARKLSGKEDLARTGNAKRIAAWVVDRLNKGPRPKHERHEYGRLMDAAFEAIAKDRNVDTPPSDAWYAPPLTG